MFWGNPVGPGFASSGVGRPPVLGMVAHELDDGGAIPEFASSGVGRPPVLGMVARGLGDEGVTWTRGLMGMV